MKTLAAVLAAFLIFLLLFPVFLVLGTVFILPLIVVVGILQTIFGKGDNAWHSLR